MDSSFIGSVFLFAGNFAPRYWALCSGQLLPINQNQALFSILGTTYGGNGQTTFALPNLKGRVAIGPGQGYGLDDVVLGEMGGANSLVLTTSNLPAHTHVPTVTAGTGASPSATLNAVSEVGNTTTPSGNYLAANKAITNAGYNASGTSVELDAESIKITPLPTVTVGSIGSSTAINLMQPYLGLTYIIALQGIFPSRD
jgi:microcystin-dependent protein